MANYQTRIRGGQVYVGGQLVRGDLLRRLAQLRHAGHRWVLIEVGIHGVGDRAGRAPAPRRTGTGPAARRS